MVNAGKDNLPCISTAMLQPVSANNSSLPLGQPPLPGQNSTPLVGSTEINSSSFSPSSSDPSRRMVEQCTQTSAHPAGISSGNSSTGQVASDQPGTGEPFLICNGICSCALSSIAVTLYPAETVHGNFFCIVCVLVYFRLMQQHSLWSLGLSRNMRITFSSLWKPRRLHMDYVGER